MSHHSLTAYGRVALAPADVVVPLLDGDARRAGPRAGRARWRSGTGWSRSPRAPTCSRALGGSPVRLSTMGRGLDQDPAAFLAAAAAGVHAAEL